MKNNIKKTIAAILVKQNSKLIIDEITLPPSLKKGQVLVKMIYSGVCASQLGEIQGIRERINFTSSFRSRRYRKSYKFWQRRHKS